MITRNFLHIFVCCAMPMVAACVHGPKENTFAPAQGPSGIETTIRLREPTNNMSTISGELLALRPEGLIVYSHANRIMLIHYRSVRSATFEQKNALRFGAGQVPSRDQREQLRLMSRYPQGLEGDLLQNLLEALNQEQIEVID